MNNRLKAQLIADAGLVVTRHPSLKLIMKGDCPDKIAGNYVVADNQGQPQGNFDIEVPIPASYPHAFPVLKEMSNKIPPLDDRHMGEGGVACVENPRRVALVARDGITMAEFFERYVHPYLCWQIVAEVEGVDRLPGWSHGEAGIVEFYQEFCSTTDLGLIRQLLSLAVHPHRLGRNSPCFCGGAKKYKRCHLELVESLAVFGLATLNKDLRLFNTEG